MDVIGFGADKCCVFVGWAPQLKRADNGLLRLWLDAG